MKYVEIFTDGACIGNPGPGGYGTILRYKDKEKEFSGGYRLTTNNRMEIMAALMGLEALKEPCEVLLVSDSRYLVDAVQKGWIFGWQKKSWVKSDKQPVLNVDLWKRLIPLLSKHNVTFKWVRGHRGHAENERCDALATAAAARTELPADQEYLAGRQ